MTQPENKNGSLEEEMLFIPTRLFIPSVVIMLVECFAITFLNLAVIYILMKKKDIFYQCRFLIMSTAFVDMLVGGVAGPMLIPWNQKYPSHSKVIENKLKFYVVVTVPATFSQLSLLHLAALALERCHATLFPIHYRNMNKKIQYVVVAALYFTDILGNFILLIYFDHEMKDKIIVYGDARQYLLIIPCFFSLLCLLIIGVSYLSIFVKLNYGKTARFLQQNRSVENRLTMTMFLVTVGSLTTWLPLLSYFLVLLVKNNHYTPNQIVITALRFLAGMNSMVNPILYFVRVKDFRISIRIH